MTTKKGTTTGKEKVKKLTLKKETIKDLDPKAKRGGVKGGFIGTLDCTRTCANTCPCPIRLPSVGCLTR